MHARSRAEEWLARARSNLVRAQLGRQREEICYEDLCFDCQQAAEKALKAVLVRAGVVPPRTHHISVLIAAVKANGTAVPGSVSAAVDLTFYAVVTRYPGSLDPLGDEEYGEALRSAAAVVDWATAIVRG